MGHLPVLPIEELVFAYGVLVVRLIALFLLRNHQVPREVQNAQDDIVLESIHDLDEVIGSDVVPGEVKFFEDASVFQILNY